jgi:hypothetical protein
LLCPSLSSSLALLGDDDSGVQCVRSLVCFLLCPEQS